MPLRTSKLCKSLPEILTDVSSLSMLEYFIQYMESMKALHLVQFWLAVESFKTQCHSQPGTPYASQKDPHIHGQKKPSSEKVTGDSNGSPLVTSHSKTTGDTMEGCDVTGNHVDNVRGVKAAPGHGTEGNHDGVGGEVKHRSLRRRDTENHKYCNCGIALHTPPSTPPTPPRPHSRADLVPLPLHQMHSRAGGGSPHIHRVLHNGGSPHLPHDVLASMDLHSTASNTSLTSDDVLAPKVPTKDLVSDVITPKNVLMSRAMTLPLRPEGQALPRRDKSQRHSANLC